jgi:hypothetical protein
LFFNVTSCFSEKQDETSLDLETPHTITTWIADAVCSDLKSGLSVSNSDIGGVWLGGDLARLVLNHEELRMTQGSCDIGIV